MINRDEIIRLAEEYAAFEWIPTSRNVFHGRDSEGTLINTPDTTYETGKYDCGWWKVDKKNYGMPYNWGGFSTIEQFRCGLWQGKYAGNVPDERGKTVSGHCVGLDCSGLVSICWNLPRKFSTRDLPSICNELDSFEKLQPGDILLIPGDHVMLYTGTGKKDMLQVIECTRSAGRTIQRLVTISELQERGYRPYSLY